MQTITLTVSGADISDVRALDFFQNPFNVGLGAAIDGSVDYTVEFTFEDPSNEDFVASAATWFPVAALTSKTANESASLTIPCRGIRIKTDPATTGTVVLYIQQAGTR